MGLADATQMFFGLDIPFFVSYYFGAIFIPGAWFVAYYGKPKRKSHFRRIDLLQPFGGGVWPLYASLSLSCMIT